MSFRTRSMWWRWIACGLAVGWSAGLWAQEAPPARKAGLWGMTVDGRQTAMRFCVGNSGDDVMRQRPFDAVRERYFAISVERRLKHPAVVAISEAANEMLDAIRKK